MKFSNSGNKLLVVTGMGSIELFSFDRCTGLLSQRQTISLPANDCSSANPHKLFYGCSFAPNDEVAYVSTHRKLYQFDLNAPDIGVSALMLFQDREPTNIIGQHQIGPDRKIYISQAPNSSPHPYNNDSFGSYAPHGNQ